MRLAVAVVVAVAVAVVAGLAQALPRTAQEDEVVGGFGVEESAEGLKERFSSAGASLLEEDEGHEHGDVPCVECTLNKMEVPEDFSGDLNELAEYAYMPTDEQRKVAHANDSNNNDADADEDEDFAQVPKYGMRPGDELVGGFGRQDDDDADPRLVDNVNLELEEGVEAAGDASEVHSALRESAVVSDDLAAKTNTMRQLQDKLQAIKTEKQDRELKIKEIEARLDGLLETEKQLGEQALKQADEEFGKAVEGVRAKSATRVVEVREEEQRMHKRTSSELASKQQQAEARWKKDLDDAAARMHELEGEVKLAEERADKLYATDRNKFGVSASEASEGQGLRARLASIQDEIRRVREEDDADQRELADLTAQGREEQHTKEVLEARLRNVRAREEALKEAERQDEVNNANLHHELDEQEVEELDDAEALAHARDALRTSESQALTQAEAAVHDKEQVFKSLAMQAAQDEIARLRAALERKERREAHEEQQLVQQQARVREENARADDEEGQARYELQKGEVLVQTLIDAANEEAASIVAKAEKEAEAVEAGAKQEAKSQTTDEVGKAQEEEERLKQEVHKAEAKTKKLAQQFREKADAAIKKEDAELKAELDKERSELTEKLEASTQSQLDQIKSDEEAKLNDINADAMMAKIHANKDEQQLATLRKENEELKRSIQDIKDRMAQQKDEWTFQQLASSQAVTFAGADQDDQ